MGFTRHRATTNEEQNSRVTDSILFVCTGNYYRSRFAEEYFNHHATARNLDCRAFSRGLARDMTAVGNVGPMSIHALQALERRRIEAASRHRFPAAVQAAAPPVGQAAEAEAIQGHAAATCSPGSPTRGDNFGEASVSKDAGAST